MDYKEPDHGYGGPAGGGVGLPGILVTSDDNSDDHVTVEDRTISRKSGILEKDCQMGLGQNSPCSHPDGTDCQDRLTTKLINIKQGRNGSE